MDLVLQMKVLPALLHRSVQPEGGAEVPQNIQVHIQAEEGEENTETGEANQGAENLSAEVQRQQPAGGGQAVSCSTFSHFSAFLPTRTSEILYF